MPSVSKTNTDEKFASIKSISAPYVTYAAQYTVTYFKELGYTYEKIFKLQPDVYGGVKNAGKANEVTFTLGEYDTYAMMAVKYYESKLN